jgi:hypothetical protein
LIVCLTKGCKVELSWSGRGRKPKYCTTHKAANKRKRDRQKDLRTDRHERGRSASRWDELWLTKEYVYDEEAGTTVLRSKPVRRDPDQVWNATGENDDDVFNRSGVFHKTGPDGLPGLGHSVPKTDDYGGIRWKLSELSRLAEGQAEGDDADPRLREARQWLKDHPLWWRFESDDDGRPKGSPADEHSHFSKDIRETAMVHGGSYSDSPDETTGGDRCSFCTEKMALLWAQEFCSEECMRDYVTTFGVDGRKKVNRGVVPGHPSTP